VLLRITADLIQEVLAGPCDVPVPDRFAAYDLLRRLAREAMLVGRHPTAESLIHRPTCAGDAAPAALSDRQDVADHIQRPLCVHGERHDPASKIEDCITGGSKAAPEELTAHWDKARRGRSRRGTGRAGRPARGSTSPPAAGTLLSDATDASSDDAQWLDEVQPQVDPLRPRQRTAGRELLRTAGARRHVLSPSLEIERSKPSATCPRHAMARDNRRAARFGNDSPVWHLHPAPRAPAGAQRRLQVCRGALDEALLAVRAPTVEQVVEAYGLSRNPVGR